MIARPVHDLWSSSSKTEKSAIAGVSRVSGTKFIMNKFMGGTKDGTVQAQERFKLVKHCSANDSTEREQQQQQQCKAGSNLIRRTVNDLIRRSKATRTPSQTRTPVPVPIICNLSASFLLRFRKFRTFTHSKNHNCKGNN